LFVAALVGMVAGCQERSWYEKTALGAGVPNGLQSKQERMLSSLARSGASGQMRGSPSEWKTVLGTDRHFSGNWDQSVFMWTRDGKVFDKRLRERSDFWLLLMWEVYDQHLIWEFEVPPEFAGPDTPVREILLQRWWPEDQERITKAIHGNGFEFPFMPDALTSNTSHLNLRYWTIPPTLRLGDVTEPREFVEENHGGGNSARTTVRVQRSGPTSLRLEWYDQSMTRVNLLQVFAAALVSGP
jgi:hypothetical protein